MPKNVFGNLYTHKDYLSEFDDSDVVLVRRAQRNLPAKFQFNIVKISKDKSSVTFSWYPDFDSVPHPSLHAWVNINLRTGKIIQREEKQINPLILHHIESMLSVSHPRYSNLLRLSIDEESAGLFDAIHRSRIGRKQYWDALLLQKNLSFDGDKLIELIQEYFPGKTAMQRRNESAIARMLVKKGFLIPGSKMLDWGCGYGADVQFYKNNQMQANGFDPNNSEVTSPEIFTESGIDIVTCTYVLNVVTPDIRKAIVESIRKFLPDCGKAYFAVRSERDIQSANNNWIKYSDGFITGGKTFQKGFSIDELRGLLETEFGQVELLSSEPLVMMAEKIS